MLDGWRGVSILMVIFGHMVDQRFGAYSSRVMLEVADSVSTLGVCIFFVISGLIITKLALRERDGANGFSARNFYVRRVLRIVPPFYAYLLFVLALAALGTIGQQPAQTLAAAGFACNMPAYGALAAGLMLCALVGVEIVWNLHPGVGRYEAAHRLLPPVLMPLSVAWLLGWSLHARGTVVRMLETGPLQFLGMISYSLCLWQQLFTAPAGRLRKRALAVLLSVDDRLRDPFLLSDRAAVRALG